MANVVDSQLSVKAGNLPRARELLDAAHAAFKGLGAELSPQAHIELARACYAQHDEEAGDAIMCELIRNHHDDEGLLESIGNVFNEIGRSEAGRDLIAQNVQSVVDLNNQAVLAAQSGQFEEAIARFLKAQEEMPGNVQIMLNLVNATLAMVQRQGWHEVHMRRAHDMLIKVRSIAPTNSKYQKLQQAWRATTEKLGRPQWSV
jgi:tetratricopeptide (TPR) repeat protein